MIKIKNGVDVRGLHIKLWEAIYLLLPLFDSKNIELVITSGLEGNHGWGSLHYVGLAVDIRIRDYPFPDELFKLYL